MWNFVKLVHAQNMKRDKKKQQLPGIIKNEDVKVNDCNHVKFENVM